MSGPPQKWNEKNMPNPGISNRKRKQFQRDQTEQMRKMFRAKFLRLVAYLKLHRLPLSTPYET